MRTILSALLASILVLVGCDCNHSLRVQNATEINLEFQLRHGSRPYDPNLCIYEDYWFFMGPNSEWTSTRASRDEERKIDIVTTVHSATLVRFRIDRSRTDGWREYSLPVSRRNEIRVESCDDLESFRFLIRNDADEWEDITVFQKHWFERVLGAH